ncbi:MAG: zinc ribbon domain-containing protein [Anaerolineae bacterium]|nr:zinc ribbon domain-containing protein [Anaerolineae bacterium]
MPVYEYRCLDCKRRFDKRLSFAEYDNAVVLCPHCGGKNVTRKIGRVRVSRSEESRLQSLENMSDPARMADLDRDPRELGRMMRSMSAELGEDMGSEFHEVVNRLEAGQTPDEIEKSIPDLGSANDDGAGFTGGLDD